MMATNKGGGPEPEDPGRGHPDSCMRMCTCSAMAEMTRSGGPAGIRSLAWGRPPHRCRAARR